MGLLEGRAGSLEPETRSRPGILARTAFPPAGRARSPGGDYGQTASLGGSVPCSLCSARWPGSPYSALRRPNGSRVPGTPPDGEVGMREETETLGKAEGVNGDGGRIRDTEGQKREEMKEKDE